MVKTSSPAASVAICKNPCSRHGTPSRYSNNLLFASYLMYSRMYCTNRPPKGDRSGGFYENIIFYRFYSLKIIENIDCICGNWVGTRAGTSRILFNVNLSSKQPSKVQFWTSILNFGHPHLLRMSVFLPDSFFGSQIFQSLLWKRFLWTIRTILVFS